MRHFAIVSALAIGTLIGSTGDVVAGASIVAINVPEPSTLAALAAGLGAMAIIKFRRRK